MFTVDIQGIPQLTQALQRLAMQAQQALTLAVHEEAERILEASLPLVPVDTGLLVSTGTVERQLDGVTIRFGGHGLAPYALKIHEDVTLNHPNGGQAKYLQQPLLAALDAMPARLAVDVARALRS